MKGRIGKLYMKNHHKAKKKRLSSKIRYYNGALITVPICATVCAPLTGPDVQFVVDLRPLDRGLLLY